MAGPRAAAGVPSARGGGLDGAERVAGVAAAAAAIAPARGAGRGGRAGGQAGSAPVGVGVGPGSGARVPHPVPVPADHCVHRPRHSGGGSQVQAARQGRHHALRQQGGLLLFIR